jgi:PAS domain S-box-containing protein
MEQELGNGWTTGVHPQDLDRCVDIYLSHFRTREPFQMEYRLLRHDGQYRWVLDQGVPNINPDSGFEGFIGSCVDITDRRATEARYRAMIDLSPQGFWASTLDGQITHCNAYWRIYTGLSDEQIVGFDWNQLVHPDDRDRFPEARHEAIDNETCEVEARFHRRDGLYEWFLVKSVVQVVQLDDVSRPAQRIVIAINIEHRQRSEEALRKTEKLAAVGRLAASIAHEINNPLEAVTNLLYLMRKESNLSLLRQYLDEAEQELARVSQIVTETLKFHR